MQGSRATMRPYQQPQKHIQNFIQNFTSSYSAARGYTVPSYRPVVPAAPSGGQLQSAYRL